jgi:hemolysin III
LALLVAGGLAYTVGVVFYIFERIPFSHAIWHTFVFAGTTLQFFSVLFYVIPGVNV